jgi:hypothetical protein
MPGRLLQLWDKTGKTVLFVTHYYSRQHHHRASIGRPPAEPRASFVDGQDVTEIGLMRDIALRTIAVLRDAGRM